MLSKSGTGNLKNGDRNGELGRGAYATEGAGGLGGLVLKNKNHPRTARKKVFQWELRGGGELGLESREKIDV